MSNSSFNHVTLCNGEMQLFYDEMHTDKEYHKLTINNFTVETIKLEMFQNTYRVTVIMIDIQVKHKVYDNKPFIHAEELGISEVFINNCQFDSNIYADELFLFASTVNGRLRFNNCQFINNQMSDLPDLETLDQNALIKLHTSINVDINNCTF